MNKISGIKIHFLFFLVPPSSCYPLRQHLSLSHPRRFLLLPLGVGAELGFAGGVMAFLFSFLFSLLNNLLRFGTLLYLSPGLFSVSAGSLINATQRQIFR